MSVRYGDGELNDSLSTQRHLSGIHSMKIHWSDIAVFFIYFLMSLSVGIWSICRPTRKSVSGFFLAGRSMSWWPVGFSMFASNIGSEHFIGLAGTGSVSGVAVILFEWGVIPLILMMGWMFLPVYINSGIYTMPEFLERRFGGQRLRIYLSFLAITTYLVGNVSVDLYSGALFVQQALSWDIYPGVCFLLGLTSLYTICGGLSTVILTDALAVIVMLVGGVAVTIIGLNKIGGYQNLRQKYFDAIPQHSLLTNTTCGYPRADAFSLFRDPIHADYPWPATLIRVYLGALWFWCANQLIVQRALAAKNIKHAKAGTVLTSYTKLFPFIIMTIPGMISRILFPDEVACADEDICREVCGNPSGCSNIAYPKLVVELLPPGARGLVLAVMVAAVVSSLTSLFNSASTIFTLDIWKKIRPTSKDIELIIVGRIVVLVLGGLSIIWIPIMQEQEGGQIIKYSTKAVGYLGAPSSAIFVLAMFWHRVTEKGAFWGMVVSAALGILRLILDFIYVAPYCGQPDMRPIFLANFHGYYYFTMQIAITFAVAISISLCTEPIPDHKLQGVTFWTRNKKPYYDKEEEEVALEKNVESKPGDKDDTHMFENKVFLRDESEQDCCTPDADVKHTSSLWRRFLELVCGLPKASLGGNKNQQKRDDYSRRVAYLHEPRIFRIIININAGIILAILAFLYIYFR